MTILIDTNRYRDFCENDPEVLEVFRRALRIAVPFVVLAELRAGFRCGSVARQNESVLTRFLNRQRIMVSYPDEDTVQQFAAVFAQLRAQGAPIPVHDIWIAALAIQHDLILYSRDSHFDCLPQLARI